MRGGCTRPAADAVLTTWPERCALSIGAKVRHPRTTPRRLMSTIHCHCSMSVSSIRPPAATPALLKRRSRPFQLASTHARAAAQSSSLRTSRRRYNSFARPDIDSGTGSWTSVASTRQPRSSNSSTSARPRPDAAPVTRTLSSWWIAMRRLYRRRRMAPAGAGVSVRTHNSAPDQRPGALSHLSSADPEGVGQPTCRLVSSCSAASSPRR